MQTYYQMRKTRGGLIQLARDLKLEQLGIPPWSYFIDLNDFCWN